ncbi:MAG: glycosyltransferase family 1 protein [Acidobacteriota bacterium]|nr:glycosyltransferase family 1 protein [Acidobacteriota bacterium]
MTEPSPNSRPILFTEIEQFGGAERAALALCRWLSERDLECHIVAYEDRCGLSAHAPFPLKVVQLGPGGGAWSKVAALRRYFANRGDSSPRPLLSGYQPAAHATLAGLREFHDLMHDTPSLFDFPSSGGLKHRLRRLASNRIVSFGLRSGGKTIVTSEFLRDECWRDFRVRAEIARMGGFSGQPDERTSEFSTGGGKQLRMLSVCRLERNKRLDWLLRALGELEHSVVAPLAAQLSQLADWRFDLAGRGPELPSLQALAKQLGLEQRINFRGFVPDTELEAMYAAAHIFLMPAVQGYGIPAIESLGRGVPVLLHRDSGVSDILLDTAWATVFDGGERDTTTALAKSIDGVLHGRHLAEALPSLPTEDAWAERVARLCDWM